MAGNAAGAFEISQTEIAAFLLAVPQAATDIESHRQDVTGNPSVDWSPDGNIPRYGRAYQWGSRYILVSLDASFRWHFIDVTGVGSMQGLIANANNPEYVSPTGNVYLDIYNSLGGVASQLVQAPANILQSVQNAFSNAYQNLSDEVHRAETISVVILVALLVVVALAVWRVKSIQLPGFTARGGA